MEYVTGSRCELEAAWDRLALIVLAEPREGFEQEYREAAARELSRLTALCAREEGSNE